MGRRVYCDYCGIYLPHNSARSRKEHRYGWKHRENFRNFYTEIIKKQKEEEQRKFFEEKGLPLPPMGIPPPSLAFAFPPPLLPTGDSNKRMKEGSE